MNNNTTPNARRPHHESWLELLEGWVLELALTAAVFAAVTNSLLSLNGL